MGSTKTRVDHTDSMVTRKPQLQGMSEHPAIARVIAALLLVFVIYGTTIEAAHRHGRIFNSANQATTNVSNNNDTGDITGSTSCAECLICQLHQHFSATLVSVRDDKAPALTNHEAFRSTLQVFRTQSQRPHSGRAPPFTC
jgi:hypothetical protein